MSLQFSNRECGHMETDDAPCRCRVPYPNAVDIAIDSDDLEDMQRRNAASVGLPLDKYLRLSDDAPCRCNCYVRRHGIPLKTQTSRELQPISTAMTVDEACAEKWRQGQIKYGPVFVGDPLEELYAEYIDALNYFNEIERRGLLTADLVYARLSTRRLAELVRTEARR